MLLRLKNVAVRKNAFLQRYEYLETFAKRKQMKFV
jgi:hypothetical protein